MQGITDPIREAGSPPRSSKHPLSLVMERLPGHHTPSSKVAAAGTLSTRSPPPSAARRRRRGDSGQAMRDVRSHYPSTLHPSMSPRAGRRGGGLTCPHYKAGGAGTPQPPSSCAPPSPAAESTRPAVGVRWVRFSNPLEQAGWEGRTADRAHAGSEPPGPPNEAETCSRARSLPKSSFHSWQPPTALNSSNYGVPRCPSPAWNKPLIENEVDGERCLCDAPFL